MSVTGFLIVAPSTVGVNEEFSVGIKVLCTPYTVGTGCFRRGLSVMGPYNLSPRGIAYMDNTPKSWDGTISIRAEDGYRGPDGCSFKDHRGPYPGDKRPIARIAGLRFAEPGVKRIEIVDPVSGVRGLSNPIEVAEGPLTERLFWADLHSQTYFSDGLRCPEELYAFARHEAFLDVFALADHAEFITRRQWEYMVAATNDSNDPGRFVTLVGIEWTNHKLGHRNLHFPGNAAPFVSSTDPAFNSLQQLYQAARSEGALVVPHHSANVQMGVDWSLGHDPEVERLVEICSIWGISERPASAGNHRPIRTQGGEQTGRHVLDAWRRGYHLGVMGGGDIHDGRPGDELHSLQAQPPQYRQLWRQGIAGIWARTLTRESIFEALWNRRVFATTNVRTMVRFSVCGQPMGSQIRHAGPRPISLRVSGQSAIARIDIVRNGQAIATLQPGTLDAAYDGTDVGTQGSNWYYARITHADGEMAWSSPVWVET